MGRALQRVPSSTRIHAYDRLSLHAETASVDHSSAQSFPLPAHGMPASLEPSPSQLAYDIFLARVSEVAVEPCELRVRESPRLGERVGVVSHANAAYNLPLGCSRPQSCEGDGGGSELCCSSSSDVWHEAHTVSTLCDSSASAAGSVGGLLRASVPGMLVDRYGMRTPAPALLACGGSASTDTSHTLEPHAAALRPPPQLLPTRLAAAHTHRQSPVGAPAGSPTSEVSAAREPRASSPPCAATHDPGSSMDTHVDDAAAGACDASQEDGSATIPLDSHTQLKASCDAAPVPSSSAQTGPGAGAEQPGPGRGRDMRPRAGEVAARWTPRRRSSGRGEPLDTDTSETLQLHMRQLPARVPQRGGAAKREALAGRADRHGALRQLPIWRPLAQPDEREHQIAELEASIRSALSDSVPPAAGWLRPARALSHTL